MKDEIVDRDAVVELMRAGKLLRSTFLDRDHTKWYRITTTRTGRLCVGAIGDRRSLKEKYG